MMRKYFAIILFVAALLTAPAAMAQHKDHGKVEKELREYRIKFLAQEMDLKGDVLKKFTEVYTRMSNEKGAIYKAAHQAEKQVKKNANATEADYKKANEAMAQAREKAAAVEQKYEAEFKKFLSAKQIYKMKQAEDKFRARLRELRQQKGQGR